MLFCNFYFCIVDDSSSYVSYILTRIYSHNRIATTTHTDQCEGTYIKVITFQEDLFYLQNICTCVLHFKENVVANFKPVLVILREPYTNNSRQSSFHNRETIDCTSTWTLFVFASTNQKLRVFFFIISGSLLKRNRKIKCTNKRDLSFFFSLSAIHTFFELKSRYSR